ncbi:beta strand repeat-containing protein [Uliginosibacterium sediminicola]|uniref:Ig domain-containing protein n=1 Tax=Uliginosibacterium sediminicola TaxID=2024550 RepID=A0ABU9YZC6_9RHOO
MTTRLPSPRRFQALVLEPRMMFDAAAVSTADSVAKAVTASAEAPGVQATPVNATITLTDTTDSFAAVDLFKAVSVTAETAATGTADSLSTLVISIDRAGSNQALVIDGKAITLEAGSGTTRAADDGYVYSVTVSGSTTTITVQINSFASDTVAGAQALIDGLAYQVLDKTVSAGTATVTLRSLSDEGGQSSDLSAIQASITIDSAINAAPVIEAVSALEIREQLTLAELGANEVAYSTDGKFAYVAGSNGIQVFAVDSIGTLSSLQTFTSTDLGSVSQMVVSSDGKSIYSISGTATVVQLSLSSDGRIVSASTVATGNGNATGGLAISSDGAYVYVGTQYNDVVIFSRDATTGALAIFGRAISNGNGRDGVIATQGDHVYVFYAGVGVLNPASLTVYQRNADGSLSLLTSITSSTIGRDTSNDHLVVSADGQSLYVADPDNGVIAIFQFKNGALSESGSVALSGVGSLALSADGSQLYAARSNGTLQVYTLESNGDLSPVGSVTGAGSGRDIAVSAQGSLLVAGGTLSRYSTIHNLNLGEANSFASGLRLSDSNFDALNDGAGNYKGASISVSPSVAGGSFGFAAGNGLVLSGSSITLDGSVIASFSVDQQGRLNLSFSANTSTAVANQVLQQLTYSSPATILTGSLLTLDVQLSDGLLVSSVLSLSLRANSVPQASVGDFTPPTVTTETAYSTTLPATLFSDLDGDTLSWSVSGLPAGLSFDPLTRTLSGSTTAVGQYTLVVTASDIYGASAALTLNLVVEQIDNRAPSVSADAPATLASVTVGSAYSQTLSAALFSDADSLYADSTLSWSVSSLPEGLVFDAATRTLSGTPSSVGDYQISVKVTDEHGASAELSLSLRVISQAEADNHTPELVLSADQLIYSSDGSLSGYNYYVNSIQLSADGHTLVIAGSTANNAGGTHYLSVYARDTASGALTLLQTFRQGTADDGNADNGIEIDGLQGVTAVAFSADGSVLYLAGYSSTGSTTAYTLSVFQVDASSGTLSLLGQLAGPSEKVVDIRAASEGRNLYVLSATTLYTYQLSDAGSLSLLDKDTSKAGLGTAVTMAVGNDGTVYVLASNSRLTIFTPASDGSLSEAGQLTRSGTTLSYADAISGTSSSFTISSSSAFNGGASLAVSDDGHIYLVTTNGFLTTLSYVRESNTLSLVNATNSIYSSLSQYPHVVFLSEDGTTLYAGGGASSKLAIYHLAADGTPVLASTLSIAGAVSRIAVSADGQSIYAGRNLYFGTPVLSLVSAPASLNLAYAEGSSIHPATSLNLADADYDALNGGAGNYKGATLSLVRSTGANADDSYGFTAGNGLSLVGSEILLNGEVIAHFSNEGGTLSVVFTGDVSTAVANALLHQIRYTNTSKDPGAQLSLTLAVQDPFASGKSSMNINLTVSELNDAPIVSATALSTQQSAGEAAVDLFANVSVSTVESAQAITRLTLTVSGLHNGASETLRIDGTTVALVAGSGTTSSGYSWQVSVDADTGVATVVLSSSAGLSSTAAASLIDGIAYANSDKATGVAGARVITLSAIQDNGATANGGVDASALAIAATVQVEVGQDPVLGAETGALELAELIRSDNYPNPYAGLLDVVSVGDQVYALRTTSEWVYNEATGTGSDVEITTLYTFLRNADGSLSLQATLDASADNGLQGGSAIGVSNDGATLYVINASGIAVFSRDTASGALSTLGSLSIATTGEVSVQGNSLYLTAGDTLKVFQRENGNWVEKDSETLSNLEAQFSALQFSSDGLFLFAGTTGGDTLVSVFSVSSDGSLVHLRDVQGANPAASAQYYYTSSLTLSPDGKTLYVVDDSSVHSFSVGSDGSLSVTGSVITLDAQPKQLIVSQDGAALIVIAESKIGIYLRNASGAFELHEWISGVGEAYSWGGYEVDFGTLRQASLSADGSQLYLTGTFSWNDGLLVLDLKPATSTYVEDGEAVALLPGATLSDPQLDVLNGGAGDYQGASIVIERSAGAQAEDVFSFLAGNGLSLENGKILLNGQAIADFVQQDGKLTLSFTASISQAMAQNVLRQIAYSNSSNDPAATASFQLQLNDGSGHTDTLSVDVALAGVNDAPSIETSGLSPSFHAEGEAVKLFQNTRIDTVEAGQTVWQVVLTLDAANASDILGVDGGKIVLDTATSGTLTTATGIVYAVKIADGKTIVTLYLNDSVERAQSVIDSLSYSNSGDALSGTRSISLSIKDSGDGNNAATASSQAIVSLAAASAVNSAPSLGGGSAVSYSEQAAAIAIAPGVTVSDAQMDAFNGGAGNYDAAVLTLSLGEGHSASDSLGFLSGNGLSLSGSSLLKDGKAIASFSIADGVVTIRFSDAAGVIPTTADVQNVLRQISYANSSDAPVGSVAVQITLVDQRGLSSAALELSIAISASNDLPSIGSDPVLSLGALESLQQVAAVAGLDTLSAGTLSSDGRLVYVADVNGAIALFSRDTSSGVLSYVKTFAAASGLSAIEQLQLSADGKTLYALSETAQSQQGVIAWFSVDSAGQITYAGSISEDYALHGGALSGIEGFALSEDGQNLYLFSSGNQKLVWLNRDASSGALSYAGKIDGDMWSAPNLWAATDIVSQGDLVYVVTNAAAGSSLIVYQRDASGALSLLGYTRTGSATLQGLQSITVSDDGRTVVVASGSQIDAFSLDTGSGVLTHLGSISASGISDVSLSTDGKALFVSLADGTLNYYATATWQPLSSHSGQSGAQQLAVSADGGLLVLGSGLDVLRLPEQPAPAVQIGGTPVLLAPALSLSDAELDAANDYQGASLSLIGQSGDRFGFQDGAGYSLSGTSILFNGSAVATLVQSGDSATLSFSASLSQAQANAILRQITYSNASGSVGSHSISLVFNDGQANSVAYSQQVTTLASSNQAPLASEVSYSLSTATVGQVYQVTLPASLFSDPDGDALSWSVSGLPSGLSFDAATRTLSGTLSSSGSYTLTVTATDPSGAQAQRSFSLSVEAANAAPLASEASYSLSAATVGQAYQVTLPSSLFSDADGDALSWSVSGLPSGLSFDATGLSLSGSPLQAGAYPLLISVSDGRGGSATRSILLTVQAESLPLAQSPAVMPVVLLNTERVREAPELSAAQGMLFQRLATSLGVSTPAGVANSPEPVPEPTSSGRALLDMLDAAEAQRLADEQADAGILLADGQRTPLALAAADGGLSARVERFSASWQRDVSGNRQFIVLPRALFRSSEPLLSISLRLADGRVLPADSGIRLDQEQGLIVAAGQRNSTIWLLLEARTLDGRTLSIPLELHADGAAADSAAPGLAGKSSLSQLLRTHAVPDLRADAARLLASLQSPNAANPHQQRMSVEG